MSLSNISIELNNSLAPLVNENNFININYSESLGKSICIRFSIEKKDKWYNGIFMNADFITAMIFQNGIDTFEFHVAASSAWRNPKLKLRKKTANKEGMIKYINEKFLEIIK